MRRTPIEPKLTELLAYLSEAEIENRTQNRLYYILNYRSKCALYRVLFYGLGKGWIKEITVGPSKVYSLTKEGVMELEKRRLKRMQEKETEEER